MEFLMMNITSIAAILTLLVSAQAEAYRAGVSAGSLGVGNGHSNSADFRSPTAYKGHITFKNNLDLSASAVNVLIGRFYEFKSGAFVVPAAGFVVGGNGSGPGISTTFGFTFFCWGLCLYTEFQQQLGIGPERTPLSGYSVRVGLDYTNEN